MSLFTRLTVPVANEVKIPIHGFIAALGEIHRGVRTKADVVALFDMTTDEATDFDVFINKVSAVTNKEIFVRTVLFDWLVLGELGVAPYTSQAYVVGRIGDYTDV